MAFGSLLLLVAMVPVHLTLFKRHSTGCHSGSNVCIYISSGNRVKLIVGKFQDAFVFIKFHL